jgi:NNP family nitrate/nitrite transporter-like MFS transporter
MNDPRPADLPSNTRHLVLGTLSFAVCFAAWGLISAFAPRFREMFSLSPSRTSLLIAVPVLLGSLGRLPIGMLADRFGGRLVFTVLMLLVAVPAWWVPAVGSYRGLLVVAFFLGIAGSSFPVGVGYVSRWTPAGRQGSALGVYGLGTIGQSAAVFLGPLAAAVLGGPTGWQPVFRGVAVLLVVWGVAFGLLARNAPVAAKPQGIGAMIRILTRERLAWVLSLFYFLTFGGFVAFSIYLPTLLKDQFKLTPADAGFRAAGFVVLSTLLRPVGGWLADRIGGARVLSGVFLGVVPFALLLIWPAMLPFSVGALGCAALLGLGNGAVFKLVPQYFPQETGTVTGLVGAMGGLGGFFPPLLLGFFRQQTGSVWPGFVLLAALSLLLAGMNRRVFLARQEVTEVTLPPELARAAEQARAGAWATFWTGLLAAAIVVGSRNLQNFDPALVVYTFATIFATWGVAYHYSVWIQKPPTQMYWRRGWQLVRQQGVLRSLGRLLPVAWTHIAAQTFIRQRSALRWWMHQLLFWGCILAVLITFPLVFGWIHFRLLFGKSGQDQMSYVTYLFGFPAGSFRLGTALAWLLFHGLDVAAVLVLGGIALALWRRMRDRGARAVQDFGRDFFPLILLFAISITGLALTASTSWLRGSFYGFLSILHAVTVIAALLFLPFGKFFHIFQRPAQLGVKLYQQVGEEGEGALCTRCGQRFASRMHVDDLKATLGQLGFNYQGWQELCPACKRITLAGAQLRLKERAMAENNG